ncbi:MAG: DUF370 domain-containing protein [Clostridiales bacterium]|nr:DUF370 domain-containing protein [Clostridiales bacterium]
MYVHLGGEVTVSSDTLISVIDLETVPPSLRTVSDLIASEEEKNRLQYISGDIPKSLIITRDRTYVSPISVGVLRKRTENGTIDIM